MQHADPKRFVVRMRDVARELGVSTTTLRQICKGGKGPPLLRLSERCYGVRRGELDAWIGASQSGSAIAEATAVSTESGPMPKAANEIVDPRDDEPFLLEIAAQLAFRDGSVSGLVLRDAVQRGELEHERLNNRIYTTLEWIKNWRALYRQKPKVGIPAYEGSATDRPPPGDADALARRIA